MKQKEMYVTPVAECIALNTNHHLLQDSNSRGVAGAEDAETIQGSW